MRRQFAAGDDYGEDLVTEEKKCNNVRNKDYATFVPLQVIQKFPESRLMHTGYDIRLASSVDGKQHRLYYSNLLKTSGKIKELP